MSEGRTRLTDVAAVAEIIAAGAVILSLIYVGQQVRQNTAATAGATYQEVVRASNEYLLAIANDSALAAIITRGNADPSSLNAEDGLRYFMIKRVFWRNMENAFVQHERGVLGDSEWATYYNILCRSAGDATWPWQAPGLSPVFVALVEECPSN